MLEAFGLIASGRRMYLAKSKHCRPSAIGRREPQRPDPDPPILIAPDLSKPYGNRPVIGALVAAGPARCASGPESAVSGHCGPADEFGCLQEATLPRSPPTHDRSLQCAPR